jgi:hypothetical protein
MEANDASTDAVAETSAPSGLAQVEAAEQAAEKLAPASAVDPILNPDTAGMRGGPAAAGDFVPLALNRTHVTKARIWSRVHALRHRLP